MTFPARELSSIESVGPPMHDIFPKAEWSPRQPSSDADLWRYIDFTQFVSILENQELWFSSVAEFFDPFEGALPKAALHDLADGLRDEVAEPDRIVARMYDALRYMTYASCWHQRDHETAAMWQLYQDRGKEVAIRTTVQDFQAALPDTTNITMGCVSYEKYDDARDFTVTRVSPFFHKRPSFAHEREYRAIISEFEVAEGARIDAEYVDKIDRETSPGRPVPVDPERLIREVVVSPVAADWIMSLAKDVVETYGLDEVEVRWSDLREEPF